MEVSLYLSTYIRTCVAIIHNAQLNLQRYVYIENHRLVLTYTQSNLANPTLNAVRKTVGLRSDSQHMYLQIWRLHLIRWTD